MKRNRNVKTVLEKLKKLQKRIREYEKLYYVEIGKITEQWLKDLQDEDITENITELKHKIEQIKNQFGKE
ncbi:MAG: hypothetical protein NZ942_03375 [Candidatus Aenigmarchaeota archaeon]|nr:hypothetical protein [Candidatus Aenigmarchaeota archaeon]